MRRFFLSESSRPRLRRRLLIYGLCVISVAAVNSASIAVAQEASESSNPLIGHWRSTKIVFEKPRDTHLFLHAEGIAETWTVTADRRGEKSTGRWTSNGKTLTLAFENEAEASYPFTFYQGQLVLPNIPNRRQFWEKIE
jgi:hypothetical protein